MDISPVHEGLPGVIAPPVPPEHTHGSSDGALTIAGIDIERVASLAVLTTSLVTAAVVAAPLALPALGLGGAIEDKLVEECCRNLEPNSGLANTITNAISSIPVVGTTLAEPGMVGVLAPAATVVGGYAAGSLVSNWEKQHEHSGKVGSAIRVGSMGLGVVLALPALLPGIAHGLLFLGRLMGTDVGPNDALGTEASGPLTSLARMIGTNSCAVLGPDGPGREVRVEELANAIQAGQNFPNAFSAVTGTEASAALLAGHLGCMVPGMLSMAVPAGVAAAGQRPDARVTATQIQAGGPAPSTQPSMA